ncbi:hypothetical protein ACFQYP_37975 [Nonomuraea antimicrobica]
MSTCLKGKGHPVSDMKPSAMDKRGRLVFLEEIKALARKQQGDEHQQPDLTPAQARPYLVKEVKAALDDLECGKDFYAVFTPKETAITQQVDDQFAF